MSKRPPLPVHEIVSVEPHQIGWLRRSELDTPGMYVWEKPNGKLWVSDHKNLVLQIYRPKRKRNPDQ